MNNIFKIKSTIMLAVVLLAGIGFQACEDDTAVTPKTLEEYHAELSSLVYSELEKVENTVVGYNKGDFKGEEFYADYRYNYYMALSEAKAVVEDPEVTIADIIEANYVISEPGMYFNDQLFVSDRRELDELVRESDTLRVHTPIGEEVGMAPQQAHDDFNAGISSARTIRERITSIERQVAASVEELNKDLEAFKAAIIK